MAFEDILPQSSKEIADATRTDIQRELTTVNNENTVNAFLEGDWISAIPIANSNRIYDFVLQLIEAKRQNFPHTAEDENANAWGSIILNDNRNPAEGASGFASITGTLATSVPTTTKYQNSQGLEYEVITGGTVTANALTVISLTRSGLNAVAITDDNHFLTNNIQVTITGAADTIYNGLYDIFVISDNEFTYALPIGPALPDAGGSPIASFNSGVIELDAVPPTNPDEEFLGVETNLLLNAPLTLQTTIPGINNTSNATFGGFSGGANQETDFAYRNRYLDKFRNPIAHYNDADIEEIIRRNSSFVDKIFIQNAGDPTGANQSISALVKVESVLGQKFAHAQLGVGGNFFDGAEITIKGAGEPEYNVSGEKILLIDESNFIYKIVGDPPSPPTGTITVDSIVSLGNVIVYFTTTDPNDPTPSPSEIAEVLADVLSIKPVGTPTSFVSVLSPVFNDIDFDFADIDPPTETMRTAIANNLIQFFDDNATIGGVLNENSYTVAIFNTVDPVNGDRVNSFNLTSPIGDITSSAGELSVFGALV